MTRYFFILMVLAIAFMAAEPIRAQDDSDFKRGKAGGEARTVIIEPPGGWKSLGGQYGWQHYENPEKSAVVAIYPSDVLQGISLDHYLDYFVQNHLNLYKGSYQDVRYDVDKGAESAVSRSGDVELMTRRLRMQVRKDGQPYYQLCVFAMIRHERGVGIAMFFAGHDGNFRKYVPTFVECLKRVRLGGRTLAQWLPDAPSLAGIEPAAVASATRPPSVAATQPSPSPTPTVATRPTPSPTPTTQGAGRGPSIVLVEPPAARDLQQVVKVRQSSVKVVGYAYGDSPISTVLVRGREVPIAPAVAADEAAIGRRANAVKFVADVRLSLGKNDLKVEAVDIEGRVGVRTIFLARDDGPVPTVTQSDVREARKGNRYAVLIGVSKYDSPEITPLRFTLNDVEALRKVLVDPVIGGYPRDNVRVLTDTGPADRRPNKINVEIAMNWLAANASQPEDTVLIYFSGHGASDNKGSYLLTQECRTDALLSTSLNIVDFNRMITDIRARKKIIIFDACHSGGMSVAAKGVETMQKRMREELMAQAARSEGEIRLLSCNANELSYESDMPGVAQGVFSHYLVLGLRGDADDDGDGFVTFTEMHGYVTKKVHQWAAARGRRQTPTWDGHASGVIIMSEPKRK